MGKEVLFGFFINLYFNPWELGTQHSQLSNFKFRDAHKIYSVIRYMPIVEFVGKKVSLMDKN